MLTTTLVHRYLLTDFAKVFIDVLRTDVADLTFFVDELEQFLARQLVALSDDAGKTAILLDRFHAPCHSCRGIQNKTAVRDAKTLVRIRQLAIPPANGARPFLLGFPGMTPGSQST
jgi:hypothetical protein